MSGPQVSLENLTPELNNFDPEVRQKALLAFADLPKPPLMVPPHVNMHCHTFYSYNGYDSSPSMIAAKAVDAGWSAAATCDFDVLDAMDEFLAASDLLGLRAAVNLETRVFFKEYADHEINSPGEPGVYYFMGAGFVQQPLADSPAAAQLAAMRAGAEARNRDLISRVNAVLGEVSLSYANDVLPLTPAGNATERHICTAYYDKSKAIFADDAQWVAYWAREFNMPAEKVQALLDAPMNFNDVCRSKLMKKGGPGYVQPNEKTFPLLDDVIAMILASNAMPMATWLDGMTSGEADIRTQLECLKAKGVVALNIIPDRNWDIKDAEVAKTKIAKLHECVEVADSLNLPINVGTELNKYGQRWVDDFTAAAMLPCAERFIKGAEIMVGHTRLQRYAGAGYCSDAAVSSFADVTERNTVFAKIGGLPAPSRAQHESLLAMENDQAFSQLMDAAESGWSA